MHANLMCGEYIKAGWVQYELPEVQANQCDSPAAHTTRPALGISLVVGAVAIFFVSLMLHT